MKKIMTLLGVIALSTTISHAMYTDVQTSDVEILRHQGYSDSALRAIDMVKSHNQGAKYQRQYSYKQPGPYHRLKLYIDPFQDDDMFGERPINFSNSWNDDETHYTTRLKYQKTANQIEDFEELELEEDL